MLVEAPAMDSVIGRSAVVLDLAARKPCCVSTKLKPNWRYGRMSRSRTLIAGERRDIGLYEDPCVLGLPGLGMAMMMALRQMAGMFAWAIERLKR